MNYLTALNNVNTPSRSFSDIHYDDLEMRLLICYPRSLKSSGQRD